MMDDIRQFFLDNPQAIDIAITIFCIIVGWRLVIWLDKNVFNKNRYSK